MGILESDMKNQKKLWESLRKVQEKALFETFLSHIINQNMLVKKYAFVDQ